MASDFTELQKTQILAEYVRRSLVVDIGYVYDDPYGFAETKEEVKYVILGLKTVCELAGLDWDELAEEYGPSDFERKRLEEILSS